MVLSRTFLVLRLESSPYNTQHKIVEPDAKFVGLSVRKEATTKPKNALHHSLSNGTLRHRPPPSLHRCRQPNNSLYFHHNILQILHLASP